MTNTPDYYTFCPERNDLPLVYTYNKGKHSTIKKMNSGHKSWLYPSDKKYEKLAQALFNHTRKRPLLKKISGLVTDTQGLAMLILRSQQGDICQFEEFSCEFANLAKLLIPQICNTLKQTMDVLQKIHPNSALGIKLLKLAVYQAKLQNKKQEFKDFCLRENLGWLGEEVQSAIKEIF